MALIKCPECGKYMLEVKGKNGTMNVCQDRECGYRENVARLTNARCPECKKRLELRGSGEGKIYVCPNTNCNFREKESQFKKRFDNVTTIKIERDDFDNGLSESEKNHITERELVDYTDFDYIVKNKDFDDLAYAAAEIVADVEDNVDE